MEVVYLLGEGLVLEFALGGLFFKELGERVKLELGLVFLGLTDLLDVLSDMEEGLLGDIEGFLLRLVRFLFEEFYVSS